MAALFVSQGATWTISAVMLTIVPRYLGASDFGKFSFAATYVGMFNLVGLLGTSTYLIKAIARDVSLIGDYVVNALYLKVALGGALTVGALGLGVVLGYDSTMLLLLAAASLIMVLGLLNDVLTAGLQALEQMTGPAKWVVVQQYFAAGMGLLVIILGGGVVAYGLAIAPAAAIPIVANSRALRRYLPKGLRPDFAAWGSIAKGGLPYLAWSAVLLVYGSVDILMLRPLAGDASVGWYAVAYKWIGIPTGIAAAVLVALLPSLSASGMQLTGAFFRRANRALRLVALVVFPVAIGMALVAPDLLQLLYGGQFDRSVPLLRILALSIPLVVVDMVLGMVLIASDRQRQWVIVGCVAAVLNPALNLLAIPLTIDWFGNGAIGAAAVTLLTELVMMAGALRLQPRGVLDANTVGYVARSALAVAGMALVVWLLSNQPLALKVMAGVVTYGIVAWLVRAASADDFRTIRLQLQNRGT